MDIISQILLILPVLVVILTFAAYSVYAERKIAAALQQRVGPNRVGPLGLLQPAADVLKLLLKEDIIPSESNRRIHFVAPVIAVTISLVTLAVIPFGNLGDGSFLVIADINVGVLYILAITSISVYGVTLAGWGANSKYSLLGGLRASAQMVSYELALGLSVVSIILLTNADADISGDFLKLTSIVEAQRDVWNIFCNPLGAVIFIICTFAEANRAPFDLVEAEQELVGGFHTEYSSMKFAMFFVAEYLHVVVGSAIISTMLFGGYLGPFESVFGVETWAVWAKALWGVGWFLAKTIFFICVFIWVRWTLPRFKYNQLMDMGWKRLLPLALLNLILVAIGIAVVTA
ncbi:MAG: NADH-quinone oxidoreductase subunit NuoH [Bacteroidota bacterium]